MKIAVCDDNQTVLDEMNGVINRSDSVKEVHLFSSPLELIMEITTETDFDLIFMDLDWKSEEKTGFQWGEEIYQIKPHIPIIFITGHNDCFAQHVWLINANILGYMTKPVNIDILNRYLEKAKEKQIEPKYLVLSKQGGKISLPFSDIIHIESHNHKAIICTEKEEYIVYEKLIDILTRLSEEFIQSHKSFLVNMNWIRTMEGKSITLRNGRVIPISRTYNSDVKRKYFEYLKYDI